MTLSSGAQSTSYRRATEIEKESKVGEMWTVTHSVSFVGLVQIASIVKPSIIRTTAKKNNTWTLQMLLSLGLQNTILDRFSCFAKYKLNFYLLRVHVKKSTEDWCRVISILDENAKKTKTKNVWTSILNNMTWNNPWYLTLIVVIFEQNLNFSKAYFEQLIY